jgi:uncharacterized protein YgbK (DUF1537 family)
VFQRFEETRKAVYAAGLGGGSYPMNSAEWFSQSTAAIDEVIALSVAASQEAARLSQAAQRNSLRTLVLNAILMAFSLLLAAATFWMVISRIIRSLGQMTEAMSGLAGGETSGAVVQGLRVTQLTIGTQIDPGVPWTAARSPAARNEWLHLALKSGNFGSTDFFTKAFDR